MKKWIFFVLALVLMINLAAMGIGCKAKESEKPAVTEEQKPPEAPAPAPPPAPSEQKPDMVKGKVEAFNKDAKKITISGNEYSLSEEAAQTEVKVGDEVEATVDGGVVKKLTKAM